MTSTIIERLGFAPTDRVAVVHVDDIGMCHSANVGAFEALENGPATCGSMMVPCPWFLEAAGRARANPRFDLGVHLTLNAEWSEYRWGPVAGRSRVPSLCDKGGYLPRSVIEVLKSARPEEVEIELRAQIDLALAAGVDVTHLDSHMGTVFFPQFFDLLTRLAADYRLPLFAPSARTDILARHGLEKSRTPFRRAGSKAPRGRRARVRWVRRRLARFSAGPRTSAQRKAPRARCARLELAALPRGPGRR